MIYRIKPERGYEKNMYNPDEFVNVIDDVKGIPCVNLDDASLGAFIKSCIFGAFVYGSTIFVFNEESKDAFYMHADSILVPDTNTSVNNDTDSF